jgi:hypothetical protein
LSAFSCGCHKPNCEIITVCDDTGFCWKVKKRRFFTNQNLQSLANDTSSYVAVLDLSNHWVPDTSKNSEAKVYFKDTTTKDPLEETFSLSLAPSIAANLSAVDNDTTPYAFVFSDASEVSDFLSDGYSLGYSNASVTIEITVPLTQSDCEEVIQTGDYTNYQRWIDSSGLQDAGSFTIHYIYPEHATEACNQGTITVSDDEEKE